MAYKLKGGNGGARPGAGHPKGLVASTTLMAQEFRRQLAALIMKDAESWLKPIEDLSKGLYMAVTDKDGNVTSVYKEKPDAMAWEKAMSRAFGKPAETLDVSSLGEKLEQGIVFLPAPKESDE